MAPTLVLNQAVAAESRARRDEADEFGPLVVPRIERDRLAAQVAADEAVGAEELAGQAAHLGYSVRQSGISNSARARACPAPSVARLHSSIWPASSWPWATSKSRTAIASKAISTITRITARSVLASTAALSQAAHGG